MPISSENMKRYPGGSTRSAEWFAIRERIRVRAGNACEGSPAYPDCCVKNWSWVENKSRFIRVVCTVAHLNHDPADCRDENLKFWCQRCHNTYDGAHRAANRKKKQQGTENA